MDGTQKVVLGIDERPGLFRGLLLSIQHLFAMFGATVLVPVLTGMSPAVALVSSGVGTLAFILITQGKVPSYLGSSFAFISPIIAVKALEANPDAGMAAGSYLVGSFMVGVSYALVALVIHRTGVRWLMKLLPPVVVGPVIMVIGLGLASVAVDMATQGTSGAYDGRSVVVALVTLVLTILVAVFGRRFFSVIPVLVGMVGGYIAAVLMGMVDPQPVYGAGWVEMPPFMLPFVDYTPVFSWRVALMMVPVCIVPIAEHIGHQLVLCKVVGRNLIADPGLDRSLMGDGVATMAASLIGGPPNTTYGENIGVLAITRAFSVYLFVGAACLAVAFGFCGKISAALSSVPPPVMGGVSILLFGIIASSGLRMLVDAGVDFSSKRNMVIASVILVLGIGGASVRIGEGVAVEGMALASIAGVILNRILPGGQSGGTGEMFG